MRCAYNMGSYTYIFVFFCHATFLNLWITPMAHGEEDGSCWGRSSPSNGYLVKNLSFLQHIPNPRERLPYLSPYSFPYPKHFFPQNNPPVKVTPLLCLSLLKSGNTQVFWNIYRGSTFHSFFTIFWGLGTYIKFKNTLLASIRISSSFDNLFSYLV